MGHGSGKGPSNFRRDSRLLGDKMRAQARRMRAKPAGDKDLPQATGGTPPAPDLPPPTPDPAKFLLIEVPNFNNATKESEAMSSYLRLGTVPDPSIAGVYDAPRASGEDLAAFATFFLDDDRKRDGSPGFVSEADRQAETGKLHIKGGWRDHSDGNRVTTTRGDKVEVIRGNYKMVVLGRQDDAVGAVGWDASGGHVEGLGVTSSIDWVQTFDGTWRVIESSEKGDTITTQHGNSVSFNYGEIQDSVTGSEDETRPGTDENGETIWVPAPNPVITSRTWARRIASQTGSAETRVPSIADETWVDTMSTRTHAGTMSDETHVDGHMSTKTIAASMSDTTISNLESMTIGSVTDVTLGNMLSATIGAVEDITIGGLLEITLGLMVEMNISGGLTVNLGHMVDLDLASRTNLTPEKTEVAGTVMRTVGVESVTAGVYKVTAGLILLG